MPDLTPIALVDDDEAYAKSQIGMAHDHGFHLTWYRTWEEAKDRIKDRTYRLVILDAKGQIDPDSPSEDIGHLHQARTDLATWRGANIHIPYVICTGFDEGETRNLRNEKRYLKGKEKEMYAELKRIVDRSNERALRDRYAEVFAVFKEKYFDSNAEPLFMEALLYVERGDKSGHDRLFMNPLRQVIEHLFIAAHGFGLLPDELIKPNLNLRLSANFMSGEKVAFPSKSSHRMTLWCGRPVFPKIVGTELRSVLHLTNWGSHALFAVATAEDTNYLSDNEEAFHEHGGSPYLLSTAVFQLMDVLVFFKRFVDEHPDPAVNRTWNEMEDVVKPAPPTASAERVHIMNAEVIRKPGQIFAYASDCYINNKLVAAHDLKDGDIIDMTVEPSTIKPGTAQAVSITKH